MTGLPTFTVVSVGTSCNAVLHKSCLRVAYFPLCSLFLSHLLISAAALAMTNHSSKKEAMQIIKVGVK